MQHIDFFVGSEGKSAQLKLCFAPPYGSGFKMNFWLLSVLILIFSCSIVLGEFPGEFRACAVIHEHCDKKENMQITLNDAITLCFVCSHRRAKTSNKSKSRR